MSMFHSIGLLIRASFRDRAELAVENLALRQQLAILKDMTKRPNLRPRDRVSWVWLSRFWANWRSALLVVQPDTVVRWHQQGFKPYWRWKSRTGKVGRPKIELDLRKLIRRMSLENPSWGVPRIQSELALLGHTVSEATVRKYRIRKRSPPSRTWRSFLNNHLTDIVAIDFFTVPTATFHILFAFVAMWHDRRYVVHFNVTAHPTAAWTAQQIVEAFPDDTAPRFLIRDRDGIYGHVFQQRVRNMGIEEVICAPRSTGRSARPLRLGSRNRSIGFVCALR